ncbi:response regulator transcription factor [Pseudomonas aeruginosa]|nr:response regulator transcription factor [Pseudomonas aeruginosa]HDZ3441789.1 response regulator transcription factor [Pseudomonas aeruginosa]
MTDVLIVDDHPVVRLAVRVLLEKNGMCVVGEADNGIDAIRLVRELLPDLTILDIGIPGLDGLTTISRIKELEVSTRILVLTSQDSESICRRCIELGAFGFIDKGKDIGGIASAVKAIESGFTYFPPLACDSVHPTDRSMELKRFQSLSSRELTVFECLLKGYTNKKIGDKLLISNKTVSTYKVRIFQKLGVTSLVDLIEYAKRNSLVGGRGL